MSNASEGESESVEEFLIVDETNPKVWVNIKLGVTKTLAKIAVGTVLGRIGSFLMDRYLKGELSNKVAEKYRKYFTDVEFGKLKDLEGRKKKAEAILISKENLYILYKSGILFLKKRKLVALPMSSLKSFKETGIVRKNLKLFFEIQSEDEKDVVKVEVFIDSKMKEQYISELSKLASQGAAAN